MYLTEAALVERKKKNHKSLTGEYVLEALRNLEFENFAEVAQKGITELRETNKKKKDAKSKENDTEKDDTEDKSEEVMEE